MMYFVVTLSFESFYFSSLNIFKIANLKLLSTKSNTWAFSGTVFIDHFFPLCMGHTLFFFIFFKILFIKEREKEESEK